MAITFKLLIAFYLPAILGSERFLLEEVGDARLKKAEGALYTSNPDFDKAEEKYKEAIKAYFKWFDNIDIRHDRDAQRAKIKITRASDGLKKATKLKNVKKDKNDNKELLLLHQNVGSMVHAAEKWDTVKGMAEKKKALRDAISMYSHKDNFKLEDGEYMKNFFFFGPPGTGKTTVARAMASAKDFTFLNVPPGAFAQKYKGEGEKVLNEIFKTAKDLAPSVIFFDEIDSMIRERKEDEKEDSRTIKNTFLTGLDSVLKHDVFIVAATNMPAQLDSAFQRRFPQHGRFLIGPPDGDKDTIMSLLKPKDWENFRPEDRKITDVQWEDLAEQLIKKEKAGKFMYSNQDITNIKEVASSLSIQKFQSTTDWLQRREDNKWEPCKARSNCVQKSFADFRSDEIYVSEDVKKVYFSHYEWAIDHSKPSIKPDDWQKHKEFEKNHGRQEIDFRKIPDN